MLDPTYTNTYGIHDDLSQSAAAFRARRTELRFRRAQRGSARTTLHLMFPAPHRPGRLTQQRPIARPRSPSANPRTALTSEDSAVATAARTRRRSLGEMPLPHSPRPTTPDGKNTSGVGSDCQCEASERSTPN